MQEAPFAAPGQHGFELRLGVFALRVLREIAVCARLFAHRLENAPRQVEATHE